MRWALIALAVAGGLALMHQFAPLEPTVVAFDLALLVCMAGAASVIKPLRFAGVKSRKAGAVVLAVGVAAAFVALNWPVTLQRSSGGTLLDRYMEQYDFHEVHSARVRATPDRVYAALRQVTFSELRVMNTLTLVRAVALGQFGLARRIWQGPPPGGGAPILEAILRPESGFLLLEEDASGEMVMGLAGRFWTNGGPRARTRDDFLAFTQPGCAKAAFDFRVEGLGGGWSRISTETRVIGTDNEGRRTMARYWRFIYPGSAAIRHMWLRAVKHRAERV